MARVHGSALVAGLAAAAMLLTACGGSDTAASGSSGSASGSSSASGAGSGLVVGLAYDIGGRGDQSFNDSAARGLDEAVTKLGVEVNESEAQPNETDDDKAERLRTLADGGATAIIGVGFAYSTPITEVSAEYPDVDFAIVDDSQATGDNIANIVFAENEGSFLVGAAAALKTTTGTVGFVGGVQTPLIEKFEAGYAAGVEAAKPGTKVLVQYLTQAPDFTGFTDPAKGNEAATGMYDQGADVVFHAAGGSGSGVFEAAAAAGGLAIGVDSDQYEGAADSVKASILTSMVKNVDIGVFDFISSVVDSSFTPGEKLYDLSNDGVSYSTSGGQVDDIVTQLDEFKAQIVDGSITVPTTP